MISFKQFITEAGRSLTSDEVSEIRAKEGIKFSTDAGHPTQRSSTKFTYRKFYNSLPDEVKQGVGLDYSAGLGVGSDLLRNEFGADIESYEPFPHKNAKDITYSGLNSLPDKQYDYIINSAVLNVVEQDIRDAIVLDIWNHLKPNGVAIIGVRSVADVLGATTAYIINRDSAEIIDRVRGSYQKGFTPTELRSYIQSLLPDAAVTRFEMSGVKQVAVKVFKDEEFNNVKDVDYEIPKKKHPIEKYLYKESSKSTWVGMCDKVRCDDLGEKFWQDMMSNKIKISEKEFLRNINPSNMLDYGEKWSDWVNEKK